MFKRIATLLLGIGLIGLGVLLFVAPERSFIIQLLTRFWPLFLVLAGLVRVAGYLIDRHPRSPVGGMMITALGGIMLAANMRGERSLIYLFGNYWFWLLLAYIIGRVLRQYTHRIEDGSCPRTFSPAAIVMMILIMGGGLTANHFSKNSRYLDNLNLPIGKFAGVSNFLYGNHLSVDDESQNFALLPKSHLIIRNSAGDVEVTAAPQSQASVRLVKRIRATSQEEAKQVAENIHLQLSSDSSNYQLSVDAAGVQQDFSTTIILTLPHEVQAGIEVVNVRGSVKLSGLWGDHTIRTGEKIEISDNRGLVSVESPPGSVEINRVYGNVLLNDVQHDVHLRDVVGAIRLGIKGGSASIEQVSGPVQASITDAQVELNEIGKNVSNNGSQRIVTLENIRNSRISLQEIIGSVVISAERSRITAQGITGDLLVNNSSERVIAKRLNGTLRINANEGAVEIEEVKGPVTVEATRDVTVRNFRGPLSVTSRHGTINLSSDEKLAADIKAVNEKGKIRLSLPEDVGFRLDAESNYGRVRLRGFGRLSLPRNERSTVMGYNITGTAPLVSLRSSNGDIHLRSSGVALAKREDE